MLEIVIIAIVIVIFYNLFRMINEKANPRGKRPSSSGISDNESPAFSGHSGKLKGLFDVTTRNFSWIKAAEELGLSFSNAKSGGKTLYNTPAISGKIGDYEVRIDVAMADNGSQMTTYRIQYPGTMDMGLLIAKDNPRVINTLFSGKKKFLSENHVLPKMDHFAFTSDDESEFRMFLTDERRVALSDLVKTYPALTITDYYILVRCPGIEDDTGEIVSTMEHLIAAADIIIYGEAREWETLVEHPVKEEKNLYRREMINEIVAEDKAQGNKDRRHYEVPRETKLTDIPVERKIISIAGSGAANEGPKVETVRRAAPVQPVAVPSDSAGKTVKPAVKIPSSDIPMRPRPLNISQPGINKEPVPQAKPVATAPRPPTPPVPTPAPPSFNPFNIAAPKPETASEVEIAKTGSPESPQKKQTEESDALSVESISEKLFTASFPGETENRYFASVKGSKVSWSGTLVSANDYRSDFVFGNAPGTKAVFETCELPGAASFMKSKVKVIAAFSPETIERLRGQNGKDFAFSGKLEKFETLSKEIYLVNAELS